GLSSAPATLTITAQFSAPTATIIVPSGTIHTGDLVSLDSSVNDPDSVSFTYAWSLVSKPASSSAQISDPAASKPTFTPDVAGDCQVRLVVTDSTGLSSAPATLTITAEAAPVVVADVDGDGRPDLVVTA